MSLTALSVDGAGSSGPCRHDRQHHLGAPERMLPCAWPGCDVGAREDRLSVSRPDRAPPLLLERRSLVLGGEEQLFIWHPCTGQG